MGRLRGKVRKRRHRAVKEDLHGGGWAFYLDKGMPWLYEFLARAGVTAIGTAEAAGGFDAPDDAHLKLARKWSQVFVTRDEALVNKALDELLGCPGILVLKAHRGTNHDLLDVFMAAIRAMRKADSFKQRIVLASTGQLKVHELDGRTWVVPAE